MSMKLENVEIVKLLPPWMRQDEANAALSRSASSLFQEPAKRIKQLRIWDKIDELDDDMLDELAWELNIDWYSSAMEISKKRATIKVAHLIMEKRGTKWAVEQLISAYFGTGYVKEWFEYGGVPRFDHQPRHRGRWHGWLFQAGRRCQKCPITHGRRLLLRGT